MISFRIGKAVVVLTFHHFVHFLADAVARYLLDQRGLDYWIPSRIFELLHHLETEAACKPDGPDDAKRIIEESFSRRQRGSNYATLQVI